MVLIRLTAQHHCVASIQMERVVRTDGMNYSLATCPQDLVIPVEELAVPFVILPLTFG